MLELLIVAPFCSLPGEPYFNRFLYLAGTLSDKYKVTLVTSKFRHFDKKIRNKDISYQADFDIILLDEPGYSENISLKRLYSHHVFCKSFSRWFEVNNRFSVVYSAYPLIETNRYLTKKKMGGLRNFKLIIDVQDVWPESISSAYPLLAFLPKLLMPFSRKADYVYSNADALVAVSQTYLNRALSVSDVENYECVYIGSDFSILEEVEAKFFNDGIVRLFYLGTISHSYDLSTIIIGFNRLFEAGYPIELHIFGGGPSEDKLKSIACEAVFFHGFIEYSEMISYVKGCDIAINPIKKYAAQTVTNKLSDYLSLGLPIISSQCGEEVNSLLSSNQSSFYVSGSPSSFMDAFNSIYSISQQVSPNKPSLLFDRRVSYKKIHSLIDKVSSN